MTVAGTMDKSLPPHLCDWDSTHLLLSHMGCVCCGFSTRLALKKC